MIKKTFLQAISLKNDESGATAIEYGLIAAGISIVIIGALALLGPQLDAIFGQITAALGG